MSLSRLSLEARLAAGSYETPIAINFWHVFGESKMLKTRDVFSPGISLAWETGFRINTHTGYEKKKKKTKINREAQ